MLKLGFLLGRLSIVPSFDLTKVITHSPSDVLTVMFVKHHASSQPLSPARNRLLPDV
jgi:hypothetical protein